MLHAVTEVTPMDQTMYFTFNEQSYQPVKVCGSLSSEDVDIRTLEPHDPSLGLLIVATEDASKSSIGSTSGLWKFSWYMTNNDANSYSKVVQPFIILAFMVVLNYMPPPTQLICLNWGRRLILD